ncbi:hypothetical protein ScPMuIL_007988 [Solemya velum]
MAHNDSSFDIPINDGIQMPENIDSRPTASNRPTWTRGTYLHVLEKGSQTGKPLLVDSLGFSYTVQKRSDKVYWRCSVRSEEDRCSASVFQRHDEIKRGSQEHNHPSTAGLLTKKKIDMRVVHG